MRSAKPVAALCESIGTGRTKSIKVTPVTAMGTGSHIARAVESGAWSIQLDQARKKCENAICVNQ